MVNKIEENEFYNEIFNYLSDVILGVETKLFNSCQENKELLAKLNSTDGMAIASNTLENYLNHVYRGLVDKNDEFVLEQFKKFGKFTDLNSVFLLNVMTVSAMNVYQKMKRTNLNISGDLNNYIDSVKSNVNVMRKYYIYIFEKDLKNCKENKKNDLIGIENN